MTIPKLHVNIGVSKMIENQSIRINDFENKLKLCKRKRVDIVCDMSVEEKTRETRFELLRQYNIPFATVPVYDYYSRVNNVRKRIDENKIFDIIIEHIESGAKYLLLHAAFTKQVANKLGRSNRILKLASRGGAIHWLHYIDGGDENPLYNKFEDILEILKRNNIGLFIGAATRPGAVSIGLDSVFISEMIEQSKLVKKAKQKGVDVIVEGVGHCIVKDLLNWIKKARNMFDNTPLKPLPIVTDIAGGLDHIAHSIAVYFCIKYGVEYICCISPAEHIGSPNVEEIEAGIDAARIGAHIAQLETDEKAILKDNLVSIARSKNNWIDTLSNCINSDIAFKMYKKLNYRNLKGPCTMCENLCPKELIEKKNAN